MSVSAETRPRIGTIGPERRDDQADMEGLTDDSSRNPLANEAAFRALSASPPGTHGAHSRLAGGTRRESEIFLNGLERPGDA